MSKARGYTHKSKLVFLSLRLPLDLKTQITRRARLLDMPVNRYLRSLARADLAKTIARQRTNKRIEIYGKPGDNMLAPATATPLGI
jgi:ribosomal protein L30E